MLFLEILVKLLIFKSFMSLQRIHSQGSECSNMGLRVLATGGVYVAGGIPPKILPLLLGSSALIESFNSHNSNIKSLVDTFPLIVVQHPNLGLSGAKVFTALHARLLFLTWLSLGKGDASAWYLKQSYIANIHTGFLD